MPQFISTPENFYSQDPNNPYKDYLHIHRMDPLSWYVERWGGKPEHLDWTKHNKEYNSHIWDGTPNPLLNVWQSIADHKDVSASSATSIGKTYLASIIVFWFLDVYPNSVVVTTSTKFSQLKNTLWKEMKKHFVKFRRFYPNAKWSDKLEIKIDMVNSLGEADQRIALGSTEQTSSGEEVSVSAAGQHAENMLIILDEGSGIPKSVLEAYINTSTAKNNVICMLGNPVSQLDTLAYFSSKKNVNSVTMSAYDHPNVVLKKEIIPGAVTVKSVKERLEEYGEEHPLFLARVRGISPSESKDSLIKIREIDLCYMSDPEVPSDYKNAMVLNSMGIDVANSTEGDKASVAIFEEHTLTYLKEFPCPDANMIAYNLILNNMDLEEKLSVYKDDKNRNYELPTLSEYGLYGEDVGIDSTGVGVGTVNEFIANGIDPYTFAGGARQIPELISKDSKGNPLYNFYNLRSQAFYLLASDIKKKNISFNIPRDVFNKLKLELASFKPDKNVSNRGFKLELKDITKKRMSGTSPNLADSVMIANLIRRMKMEGILGGVFGVHI